MAAIAGLPEEKRRCLVDPKARDDAYPIDMLPIAVDYEETAMWDSLNREEDDRIRYYGFWRLFRAAAIRGARLIRGDDSFDNRTKLAEAYIQMSTIMLDHEQEGDRLVLIGDLNFAVQCAQSAYNLIRDSDGPIAIQFYRERAQMHYEEVMAIHKAIETHPDRIILRPRYGPFPLRAASSQ
jgi:hypothetical protein